jgi:diacylglycerol kinase (ATP)
MPQKIKLILNPITNHGRSVQAAAGLRPLTAGLDAEWCETQGVGHATRLARQAGEEGCTLVVAAGGDGTVHEVINGLMQIPQASRPVLGILPLGSGNDFAHILGIPDDPAQALHACLHGSDRIIDMGSVRDETGRLEYFNNTLGIGFDAVVTIRTRRMKRIHGFMMYFVATLQTVIRNFDPLDLHVETDRASWDQPTIMLTVGNGPREGGGFMVTPQAKLDDGLLEFVSVRKISRPMMFRLIPEFMKGTHARFAPITMGQCTRMKVSSRQPMYVHLDGEVYSGFGSDVHGLTIEILPDALRYAKE